jgi:hypothetical protein
MCERLSMRGWERAARDAPVFSHSLAPDDAANWICVECRKRNQRGELLAWASETPSPWPQVVDDERCERRMSLRRIGMIIVTNSVQHSATLIVV